MPQSFRDSFVNDAPRGYSHVLLAGFGVIATIVACGGDKKKDGQTKPAQAAPMTVQVAEVVERPVDRTIQLSGSLASPSEASIAAEVEGKIASIKVDLGDEVKQGALLGRIEPSQYQFEMQQADAQRELSASNLRRIEQLSANKAVAAQELDDARAKAAQAEAAASLARKRFQDTDIRAPFAGAIARRIVSAGDFVKVGDPLFDFVVLDPLKLTGEVPERYLASVRLGDPVAVTVDAYPGQTFDGRVGRVSPAVNAKSRSFAIEATIPNATRTLRPGLFAHATLTVGNREPGILVPEAALSAFAGVTKVYLVESGADARGIVRERPVEIEQRTADAFAVVRGQLKAGDRVATSGLGRLADGVEVTIK